VRVTDEFKNQHKGKQMSKHKNGIQESAGVLVDDTRELLAATAECAEEKVMAARERISDALESARGTYVTMQKKAVQSAKAADKAIRANPYQSLGIALSAGLVIGFLFARRK
jgi:ElaB/YqjD/DUF883 family membrane-anchored ribosome-binding protein